jgi:hypothetical protein
MGTNLPPSVNDGYETNSYRAADRCEGDAGWRMKDRYHQITPATESKNRIDIRHRPLTGILNLQIRHHPSSDKHPDRGDRENAGEYEGTDDGYQRPY